MNHIKHWLQIDHIIFLFALILIFLNIVIFHRMITILVALLLTIAFVYDLLEKEVE